MEKFTMNDTTIAFIGLGLIGGSLAKGIKKARPDMIIGVGGCMTQQASMAEKLKKSFPYVDIVFGTHALWRLPELIYKKMTVFMYTSGIQCTISV